MTVSDSGRVHYASLGIQRIEPSGNEISPLLAGLASPNLVTTYENAAIAVQMNGGSGAPQIVRVSAADTVDWTQTIERPGRCLSAHVIESAPELVVVAGAEGALSSEACGWGRGENLWVAALSPLDGRVLWSQVSSDALSQVVTVAEDISISTDGDVFIGGTFGLKALRPDGTEIWYREEPFLWDSFSAIESLSDNTLAMAEASRIHLVDSTDGTEQEESLTVDALRDAKMKFDGDETLYVVGQRALDDEPEFVQHRVSAVRWSPQSP